MFFSPPKEFRPDAAEDNIGDHLGWRGNYGESWFGSKIEKKMSSQGTLNVTTYHTDKIFILTPKKGNLHSLTLIFMKSDSQ